ncbi:hypothetical protein B0J11DRAFT_76730 [Dendryphion nanum]|uniref:Uncharacterized protein n=1 Tax=Dendryphion nanum TaxID=256645 RepID=A0A9P9DGY6_9PLEO|nr:hypothetical protein B0J11DRAFT_76730 [Dendryphion nanum]
MSTCISHLVQSIFALEIVFSAVFPPHPLFSMWGARLVYLFPQKSLRNRETFTMTLQPSGARLSNHSLSGFGAMTTSTTGNAIVSTQAFGFLSFPSCQL